MVRFLYLDQWKFYLIGHKVEYRLHTFNFNCLLGEVGKTVSYDVTEVIRPGFDPFLSLSPIETLYM